MPDATPFRLTWSATDLGGPPRTDFCAKDQGKRGAYCRIYKAVSSPNLGWFWTASDGHRDLGTGYAPTAREAATKAEATYFGAAK